MARSVLCRMVIVFNSRIFDCLSKYMIMNTFKQKVFESPIPLTCTFIAWSSKFKVDVLSLCLFRPFLCCDE